MSNQFKQWLKRTIKELTNPVYCKFCGSPIMLYDEDYATFYFEAHNKLHYACLRQYKNNGGNNG